MEQPKFPNSLSQTTTTNNPQRKKPPTTQELISHYKTQGLDQEQASIKVIEDLQSVLFRVIASNSKNKKDRLVGDTSKKIDVINNRLAIVDLKLDTKPGYGETFALGVASGAALNGIGSVWPHVLKGLGQIWSAVRTATDPSTGS
ncbi:hypothetical protein Ddye_012975 [Dipteronia dyeriana]|uniref:Uncharacterized protein n=1 Tax=Dipteronia dyeriana TaxID=168575 RepID=A0AAD9X5C4_9ROSI|nr:hypothetical protein Ddye_012975 [Dipteronia dyeriana]